MKRLILFSMMCLVAIAVMGTEFIINRYSFIKGITTTVAVSQSLFYKFNTTRSKYKGEGAGNDEKNRF